MCPLWILLPETDFLAIPSIPLTSNIQTVLIKRFVFVCFEGLLELFLRVSGLIICSLGSAFLLKGDQLWDLCIICFVLFDYMLFLLAFMASFSPSFMVQLSSFL